MKTTMKKTLTTTITILIVLFGFLYNQGYLNEYEDTINKYLIDHQTQEINSQIKETNFSGSSFRVANWNLQIFGQSKASNDTLLNFYAELINDYDIIFIQEIRDSSQTAFPKLTNKLPEFESIVSSRAGQSTSKEQVGILYRDEFELIEVIDYNNESLGYRNDFNRPPIAATFKIENYTFTIYNMHTDPDEVTEELNELEKIVLENNEGNIMILGDLNADGNYYNNKKEVQFDSWNWIIKDQEDTTVSKNDNSYDRIILNSDMSDEFLDYGIYRDNIDKKISDHYLIWGEFNYNE
jgi:endonuclease/exonuclease/phosphatase family metal-dependent hydrolase